MQRNERPVPPGIANGHKHAEAFCLMQYEDEGTEAMRRSKSSGICGMVVGPPQGRAMIEGLEHG
jgi:hypothetical protein